jgi:catechol 2,3-dioxygenase-like lactoylglutathione lyase family enzyme
MSGFTVKEIDHVVLRVADIERALAFYCGVLGCREERRLDDTRLVQLRAGRSMIDLVDIKHPAVAGDTVVADGARNMDHLCLIVEPFDETLLRAHLQEHGISAGETASRYGAEGSGPSFYIEDPDGNTVELKGPRTP